MLPGIDYLNLTCLWMVHVISALCRCVYMCVCVYVYVCLYAWVCMCVCVSVISHVFCIQFTKYLLLSCLTSSVINIHEPYLSLLLHSIVTPFKSSWHLACLRNYQHMHCFLFNTYHTWAAGQFLDNPSSQLHLYNLYKFQQINSPVSKDQDHKM